MLELISLIGSVLDLLSGIQDISVAADSAVRFIKSLLEIK
jgi:hypothetical protein